MISLVRNISQDPSELRVAAMRTVSRTVFPFVPPNVSPFPDALPDVELRRRISRKIVRSLGYLTFRFQPHRIADDGIFRTHPGNFSLDSFVPEDRSAASTLLSRLGNFPLRVRGSKNNKNPRSPLISKWTDSIIF